MTAVSPDESSATNLPVSAPGESLSEALPLDELGGVLLGERAPGTCLTYGRVAAGNS